MAQQHSAQHANSMQECVFTQCAHIWDIWRINIWCVCVIYVLTWNIFEDLGIDIHNIALELDIYNITRSRTHARDYSQLRHSLIIVSRRVQAAAASGRVAALGGLAVHFRFKFEPVLCTMCL